MNAKNRHYRRSRISEKNLRRLLRYFAMDLTATVTATLPDISVRSTNSIYLKLRSRIATSCEQQSPLQGAVEADESYFGPRPIRSEHGHGAYGKTIVFGLLKRDGRVYTEIIPNCTKTTLQEAIRGHIAPDTVIHSDGWRCYDELADIGFDKHFRVNHSVNEFTRGEYHINGIESFWRYAKRRLQKFNGIFAATFYLHFKETEFRFNHRRDYLYLELLRLLRLNPL